jgi:uncharacterized RDD family membrane protein YckC
MSTAKPAYAGIGVRALATLVDYIVLGTVASLALVGRQSAVSPEGLGWEHFAWVIGLSWPYFALLESSSWQGTVGKRLLGLRVADLNGGRIDFGRANIRHLSKLLAYPIWFGSLFTIAYTFPKQALHDLVARTVVLRN